MINNSASIPVNQSTNQLSTKLSPSTNQLSANQSTANQVSPSTNQLSANLSLANQVSPSTSKLSSSTNQGSPQGKSAFRRPVNKKSAELENYAKLYEGFHEHRIVTFHVKKINEEILIPVFNKAKLTS